jgi:hypothetical protein
VKYVLDSSNDSSGNFCFTDRHKRFESNLDLSLSRFPPVRG